MWPPKSSSYAYTKEIQEDLIIQFRAVRNFRVNIPFVALTCALAECYSKYVYHDLGSQLFANRAITTPMFDCSIPDSRRLIVSSENHLHNHTLLFSKLSRQIEITAPRATSCGIRDRIQLRHPPRHQRETKLNFFSNSKIICRGRLPHPK